MNKKLDAPTDVPAELINKKGPLKKLRGPKHCAGCSRTSGQNAELFDFGADAEEVIAFRNNFGAVLRAFAVAAAD